MPRKTDYSQWDKPDLIAHIENWKSARKRKIWSAVITYCGKNIRLIFIQALMGKV